MLAEASSGTSARDVTAASGPAVRVEAESIRRARANLGASLAEAVNKDLMKPDSAESELHYMARVGSDSLHGRLPALLRQVHGRGVVLDWAVLLEDLSWWDRSQDRIATRWLEDFFRVRAAAERRTPDDPDAPGSGRGGSGTDREYDQNNDSTPEENE